MVSRTETVPDPFYVFGADTMDDFSKYEKLREGGASPRDVYLAGKADGLDEITLLRLVRSVCGLSLAEAKQVSGAAALLDAGQEIKVGGTVYWEGWSSDERYTLMQARVSQVKDGMVHLEDHRKFRITQRGLEEVPMDGPGQSPIRESYFQQSLGQRLSESLRCVDELSRINSQAV